MRRTPIVLAATIAGTAAVVGFNPASPSTGSPATVTVLPSGRSGPSGDRPLLGRAVHMRYGTVQVQAVLRNGRLVQVRPIQLPAGDGRSQQISAYAAPQLQQQALHAQSARVDGVSGATYTSEAYRSSLQGALDQVGRPHDNGQSA